LPYGCFNPTLYLAQDGLTLVYRKDRRGSTLWAIPLDAIHDSEVAPVQLASDPQRAFGGTEDPRHFSLGPGNWLMYHGVAKSNQAFAVTVLCMRLDSDNRLVGPCFAPRPSPGFRVEKNWGFFDPNNSLKCVWRIKPHTILAMDEWQTDYVWESNWHPQWIGGHMRGGASPVLHGSRYWSFFHGALDLPMMPHRFYSVGCYSFAPEPPFEPLSYTPRPIILPPREGWPRELGVSVVWPGGAVWHGGRWILSLGIHDAFCEIATVDHDLLMKEMVSL
jgi:predicted GH43/DUF377 family glycosyl hydrolase